MAIFCMDMASYNQFGNVNTRKDMSVSRIFDNKWYCNEGTLYMKNILYSDVPAPPMAFPPQSEPGLLSIFLHQPLQSLNVLLFPKLFDNYVHNVRWCSPSCTIQSLMESGQ